MVFQSKEMMKKTMVASDEVEADVKMVKKK